MTVGPERRRSEGREGDEAYAKMRSTERKEIARKQKEPQEKGMK